MEVVETLVRELGVYIIIGLIVFSIILLIMLIVNSARISKLERKYKKFMRSSKDKNIEELLLDYISKVKSAEEKANSIQSLYKTVDDRLNKCVQKVSMVRYKAFDDLGSAALSFSIALLDANNDGVILTGIYGRNECTTYAKPIDRGVPKYDLSEEENNALQEALKKK